MGGCLRKGNETAVSFPKETLLGGATDKIGRRPRINFRKASETDWRQKVDPFFVRLTEGYKKVVQLSASPSPQDREEAQRLIKNPPAELVEEARRLGDEFAKSGRVAYLPGMTMLGLESIPRDPTISDSDFMLSWLSWFRYKKSFPQLAEERKTDRKAAKQFLSVVRDYDDWRFGRDPEKLRFKTDREHFAFVACGLNFGIADLAPEELADCCDALCACGKRHSPENLRKLRASIVKTTRMFKTSPS